MTVLFKYPDGGLALYHLVPRLGGSDAISVEGVHADGLTIGTDDQPLLAKRCSEYFLGLDRDAAQSESILVVQAVELCATPELVPLELCARHILAPLLERAQRSSFHLELALLLLETLRLRPESDARVHLDADDDPSQMVCDLVHVIASRAGPTPARDAMLDLLSRG